MDMLRRYGKVTHCIFDNDGLLMDTENLYTVAVQQFLDKYDKKYSYEVKSRVMGTQPLAMANILIKEYSLPLTPEECVQQVEQNVVRIMDHTTLMPGACELLMHLHNHRVPIAMATGSSRRIFNIKARPHLNLLPVFHHIVCGCDPEVKRGKPEPDIFLVAASRFHPRPKPECCLVFEDSPNGMQAGRRAGMQVVMVPDPRVPKQLTEGATVVLPSLAHFNPEEFGLPPYDTCSTFEFG